MKTKHYIGPTFSYYYIVIINRDHTCILYRRRHDHHGESQGIVNLQKHSSFLGKC